MKKFTSIIAYLLIVSMLMLTACGQPENPSNPAPGTTTSQSTAATTLPQQTSPSTAPSTAPDEITTAPTTPTTIPSEPTTVPSEPVTEPTVPPTTQPSIDLENLPQTNVYLVGDSTVCAFDDKYYYPRYGYGTQLGNYLNEKVTIHNLALSGRSSKSFLEEANYQTLCDSLQPGDYLIIGFGHNDEKSDDSARFTDASKPYTDPSSFGYHLYEFYIKLALDAGATPILCTPIVRATTDNDYTGSEAHITSNGNYRQAIIELGTAVNVAVIDLTAITIARYESIGYNEAAKYHATIAGQYAEDGVTIVANISTVDKTHLNIYGAKYVAYRLACELKNVNGISYYVCDDIVEPTEADLISLANYVVPSYLAPDLENYAPAEQFTTLTPGWYGTAFGDVGGNPQSKGNGFTATETEPGIFTVGQSTGKGKISSTSDGFAFAFTQVEANKNFIITVTATITTAPNSVNQAAFGLMLRDDVYLNETAKNTSIISNYVTAGVLGGSKATTVLFSRENAVLNKGSAFENTSFSAGDTFTMTIERVGQSVTTTVVYNGETYTNTYYDFDFLAVDTEFMYVGMFATRGTVVEFTDLTFTITGDSQGA